MTLEDNIPEASKPIALQEVDASTPLDEIDSVHAVCSVKVSKPQYIYADVDHLKSLLDIVSESLRPEEADVVYRVWSAYAAGYTGRRCLTCSITMLDYWYTCGRLMREAHDAPGMLKRCRRACAEA